MQHIAKFGINISDEEYAHNFWGDYEDKARYMHEKYIAQNVVNEESKVVNPLVCEKKVINYNKEDNQSKSNEPENDRNSNYNSNQNKDSLALSMQRLRSQAEKEYSMRNQDHYSDDPKDDTIKNVNQEKEKLRRLAAQQYSSSSDSFNWERDNKLIENEKI